MNYPTQPQQCSEPARKLNILMTVIDGARWDRLKDTIVIVTGDHGQEFNEYEINYWGHGSNFGEYQLRAPMVVHWPGKQARRIDYRTENFDIAPNLMEGALGCAATLTE